MASAAGSLFHEQNTLKGEFITLMQLFARAQRDKHIQK